MSDIFKENKRFWEKCFRDADFDFMSPPSKTVLEIIKQFQKYKVHEEENREEFILLDDGTKKYISEKRKGMLWRSYSNEEIKTLCKNVEILEFKIRSYGKREVWIHKKVNNVV